jgi:hypothetical protein
LKVAPSLAIDLPLKILVWEDTQNKVWIPYKTPGFLASLGMTTRKKLSHRLQSPALPRTESKLTSVARNPGQPYAANQFTVSAS